MAAAEWHGVLLPRDALNPAFVERRDRLADAARSGDWATVLAMVDAHDAGMNDWRIGGASWFSPLHQAAWLGASAEVAEALIERGAWRTLRDADGRRPVDIARERGHAHLVDVLEPTLAHSVSAENLEGMSERLQELVMDAAARAVDGDVEVRRFDVAVLAERGETVSIPIPGMYGGFVVEMFRGRLYAESWSRVVGGSGRAWIITGDRTTLVDEGFV